MRFILEEWREGSLKFSQERSEKEQERSGWDVE